MSNTIYTLQLEENKYYVGKTTKTVQECFEQHLNGKAGIWTQRYKPIRLIKTIQSSNLFHDDFLVKRLMLMFGIDNVRGGSYCQEHLNEFQYSCLQREFCHYFESEIESESESEDPTLVDHSFDDD